MTVTIDQQTNMEVKLMRVLLAFSQSIEETLSQNRNSINEIERKFGLPVSQTKIKELDRSQLDSTNHALYTATIVRNVINRSKEFSDEIKSISSNVKLSPQQKQQQSNAEKELEIQKYKDEIESLKLKVQQLESTNNSIVNNNISNTPISTVTNSNTAPNSTNLPTTNDYTSTTMTEISKLGDSSSSIGSNISSASSVINQGSSSNAVGTGSTSASAIASDWDTKFQTELQLNEMLSEFLKDDFELINTMDTSTSSNSSSNNNSSNSNNNNSSSPTPSTPTHTSTPPQNLSTSSLSPVLTHTSSTLSMDSPSKSTQKKAMLTDLLDQIDLESNNSPTSKSKKSKFKFF